MYRLVLVLSLLWPAFATAEEVYGDAIAPKDVPESVEQCEYDLLVEQQTCNRRINKSECIKETHRYCLENYSDLPYPGPRDAPASGDEAESQP